MSERVHKFTTSLIIDDSEIDVLINRRLMEIISFSENVVVMHTAEDALAYLKDECTSARYAPDLIFLDIYLPGMTGYDFIEEFKKLPSFITEKTKIVVLSVILKPELWLKMAENKFVYCQLEKPLTREVLIRLAETFPKEVSVFS